MCGKLLFSDMLYMLVRYASPSGPISLRCLMLTLSGPVELLFLLCFIASYTCVVVFCSLCVSYICVCLCCVFDCVGELLLNAFVICEGEVIILSLKVIVLF